MKDPAEIEQRDMEKPLLLLAGGALIYFLFIKEKGKGGGGPVPGQTSAEILGPPTLVLGQFGKRVDPNTNQRLKIQVRNTSARNGTPMPATFTGRFIIYEGSKLWRHGTKLKEVTAPSVAFGAGETKYMYSIYFVTEVGTIDKRDVGFILYHNSTNIVQDEWDDVYHVRQVAPTTTWSAEFVTKPVLAQRSSV